MTNYQDSPLYRIANPRSMVFFGAGNNIGSMGANLFLSNRSMGFPGPVYPVHYKDAEVMGQRAYKSVLDLPEAPDLAVIVLPTELVNQTLAECGEKGVKRAVIVSGGFKEVGGGGPAMEKELKETAARFGIRLLGPNCLGVAHPSAGVNTTFIPFEGRPGYIGLASQSGSFVTQMFEYLSRKGLGFSTALSVGNEVNIDLVDCLEYLADDPETKVIALYVEGLNRGREFVRAAREASLKKPVVAFYIGGSETGRKAGLSHTGALAGPDKLYDGIFRQSGVVRARTVSELFEFCWVLGTQPEPEGPGVVIQTNSGGPGAAGADACGRAGLKLPPLSDNTLEKLKEFVPHTGSVNNPVDLTFSRNHEDFYSKIPLTLLEDENSHSLMIYFLTPIPVIKRGLQLMGVSEEDLGAEMDKMVQRMGDVLLEWYGKRIKPVVGYTWRSLEEPFSQAMVEAGLPLFDDPERAARALAALWQRRNLKEKLLRQQEEG